MTFSSGSASPTISLLAPGDGEEAQARWWRPISWKWPNFAPPPTLEVLEWGGVSDASQPVRGAAVLVVAPAGCDGTELFRMLRALSDQGSAMLVLAEEPTGALEGASLPGLTVVPSDADPSVVAAMLCALAQRQDEVESLRAEISVARRFQGGLRGEIEKIHDELQLAASVQREFLPRCLPVAERVDIQVLFRPCGYVSGDIYDVQQVSEHEIGFFVADAVGHGVPAALMTMVLCRCLTTSVSEHGRQIALPPGKVMELLNQDLIRRHGDSARFATAVYGVIDTRSRRVSVAGAGHPYPLLLRPDGSAERLETSGGMLGLFPDDQFGESSVTLGEADMLVVYSDGFETAFPPADADQFGRKKPNTNYVERFGQMAHSWRSGGLTASIREMCEHIDRQNGSLHQRDDLTAMVIVPSSDTALDRLFRGEAGERLSQAIPGPAAPLG